MEIEQAELVGGKQWLVASDVWVCKSARIYVMEVGGKEPADQGPSFRGVCFVLVLVLAI